MLPLLDIIITTSLFDKMPISPCSASDPCIKTEGEPVEFSVAATFIPTKALLPIPVTIILPSILAKYSMTLLTSSAIYF